MKPSTKIANGFQPLTTFLKGSNVDVWQSSDYTYQVKTGVYGVLCWTKSYVNQHHWEYYITHDLSFIHDTGVKSGGSN